MLADQHPAGQSAQVILRNRFISSLAPASDADTVRAVVAEIKQWYGDFSHRAPAVVAGATIFTASVGCSDNSEPVGIAGQPMLNALLHSGSGQIVAVVTRYFGNSKLVRANSGRVRAALEVLETVHNVETVAASANAGLPDAEPISTVHPAFRSPVEDTGFSDRVQVWGVLPTHRREEFIRWFRDLTFGQGEVQDLPLE